MMNADHVEAVLGHAVSIASQSDSPRDRELGPIHLLKYLYLADLAFAKKRHGQSFTGAQWRFYKFGPWAAEAFLAIEPSMEAIGATRRTFASQYREDSVRWSLTNRPDRKSVRLPREVALVVARAVRKFGADTSALLHHVYRTRPMLRAAPGEMLDLTPEEPRDTDRAHQADAPPVKLSKTKVKKLREGVRERIARRRSARQLVEPDPPPRFDEVFAAGAAWLDGPEPEPISGRLSFSNDVWYSRARGESELP
jgi:hypothetical protein